MSENRIEKVEGKAIVLFGDDIDTDQILPARYMSVLDFETLGKYAFSDQRADFHSKGKFHPLDAVDFGEGCILVVGKNFGCGSSREHAAQALKRFGVRGIIGESFGEIFFGNTVSVGIPTFHASSDTLQNLRSAIRSNPFLRLQLDLEKKKANGDGISVSLEMEEGPRQQFLAGKWNATNTLLDASSEVAALASKLLYWNGFNKLSEF